MVVHSEQSRAEQPANRGGLSIENTTEQWPRGPAAYDEAIETYRYSIRSGA
jgi:hypothetical protein